MKKTIFTCDKCKTEQTQDQIHALTINIRPHSTSYTSGASQRAQPLTTDWCESCCLAAGIQGGHLPRPIAPADATPSIEDLITDIISAAVANELANR